MAKKPPNPTDVFVGQRVRMARLMLNMSQEKLGDAIGLTFQQVQKYEKGTNRIGMSRMEQISKALKQPVSWFVDEQPNGKRQEGSDIITQMASAPYGLDLAKSFLAIKHNKVRHTVAQVARDLAAHG